MCRFQDLLSSQFSALEGTLVASFEKELSLASQRAVEAERVWRMAAEVDVRRLELEVQGLKADNDQLRQSAEHKTAALELEAQGLRADNATLRQAVERAAENDVELAGLRADNEQLRQSAEYTFGAPARAVRSWSDPDEATAAQEPVPREEHRAMELSSHARSDHDWPADDCSAECARDGVYPTELPPPLVPPQPLGAAPLAAAAAASNYSPPHWAKAATPKGSPRRGPTPTPPQRPVRGGLAAEALGGTGADEERRAPAASSGPAQSRLMPSKIPKPSSRSSPKPAVPVASFTLEDLDDQQLLKLTSLSRPVSATPLPNARSPTPKTEDRSATPQPKQRARRSADDSVTSGKAGDLRTRLVHDKRTLRKMNRDSFKTAIKEWREQHTAPGSKTRKANGCQVFVRLRPMFDKERQQGEFDVVSAFEDWGEVVVHNCLFQPDLVRMYVHHLGFAFPRVFGQDAVNEDVYAECGASLVSHALGGQMGTLFMFGQTGSGKTYTMSSIIELAMRDIFSAGSGAQEPRVKLRTFEIAGKKCFDLLSRQRAELKLLDSDDGRTNIVGAEERLPGSVEECQKTLAEAFGRRATASHGRNEESSRSHCICIVELPAAGGSLVLVDCAGTERRQDTDQHSLERTKESAEINASLHALKECIRYRAKEHARQAKAEAKAEKACEKDDEKPRQVHVPYRSSYLTRVLHESFTRPGSRLAAIGTVAPAATDAEHSLSTLRTLQLLLSEAGNSDAPNFEQKVDVDPRLQLWSGAGRRGSASAGAEGGGGSAEQRVPGSSPDARPLRR